MSPSILKLRFDACQAAWLDAGGVMRLVGGVDGRAAGGVFSLLPFSTWNPGNINS